MNQACDVFAFYRFVSVADPAAVRASILFEANRRALKGTLLLAHEGVNATLAGERARIEDFLCVVAEKLGVEGFKGRWSHAQTSPFRKMRVKLRREIVTLGRPDINPVERTGTHVDAKRWNELLEQDDLVLIDTRNGYEIEVGTFPNAIDPATASFRDFPKYVEQHKSEWSGRPVAMFCTGGIRCEKASALLLDAGIEQVYQLDGGILGYLENTDQIDNKWQGECFVFDSRVAVDAKLTPGHHVQCHACRRPVAPADLEHEHYEEGLSCPACFGSISDEKLAALKMRRKQSVLRRARSQVK